MIDITKKYKTRDGKEVRIYAIYENKRHSVHGAVLLEDEWCIHCWTSEGAFSLTGTSHNLDLVEVKEKKTIKIGVAVFKDGKFNAFSCESIQMARDLYKGQLRALPMREITYEEGEGL